jgi:glutathione synthase/RimK-type ligase-like ATP-grasp enzyme
VRNWLQDAEGLDVIVGMPSSEPYDVQEILYKFHFLETYMGKACYPTVRHVLLYENKSLEAFIAQSRGLPFAGTHISCDKADAMRMVEDLTYPVVSKIVPASGSLGVQLVRSLSQARRIVDAAFSQTGRRAHVAYFRQKDYVYFQDFVPNDGYDIRAIVIGAFVFGYYRKVPPNDFRASGMNLVEKRALPKEAMMLARRLNVVVESPMLVVDMLHGSDGYYYIIEFSPFCQMDTPEQLHVDGIPGAYVFDDEETCHFEEGKWWNHELALKEYLVTDYLPKRRKPEDPAR